jgi:hypothetical protein
LKTSSNPESFDPAELMINDAEIRRNSDPFIREGDRDNIKKELNGSIK